MTGALPRNYVNTGDYQIVIVTQTRGVLPQLWGEPVLECFRKESLTVDEAGKNVH